MTQSVWKIGLWVCLNIKARAMEVEQEIRIWKSRLEEVKNEHRIASGHYYSSISASLPIFNLCVICLSSVCHEDVTAASDCLFELSTVFLIDSFLPLPVGSTVGGRPSINLLLWALWFIHKFSFWFISSLSIRHIFIFCALVKNRMH